MLPFGAAGLLFLGTSLVSLADQPASIESKALSELEFRCIGPAVTGGRIHDVEALPQDPSTIYVAAASGGLWKSTNQGTTWKPLFDDQPVSTFGDLAVSPSHPDILWAGTGEQQNRQSTSWGNGVYRSTDGGKTWTHRGLTHTRHIGRVCVHPQDPDVAYVAALGNLWASSKTRGVFKTSDGGKTWKKVLFINKFTGAVDMVMDPAHPQILYAATYQRLRRTWGFNGGGPGSGVYKTTDGGETWTELTQGLPQGDKGRIGLAIAQTNPDVLYATIQHAEKSGTYRTEDAGGSWKKVNNLNPRPMYYSHIFVDPTDENRVYVLGTEFYMSEDGGETFLQLPTRPTYDVGVHSDHHTLWIDPQRPEHFYLAGDAGLHETWDRGQTYRRINNIPIGQFYAIGLDMRDPYFIYGGMQDNHSWMGPSANRRWIGIINGDWSQIGFGDGMYNQPDPTSHRYVYVGSQNGSVVRLDAETGDHLDIEPRPGEGQEDYRFDWVTPSLVSQHDPSTFYLGGNRLFISHDRGETWSSTPDLTKQIDRKSLKLMGVKGSEPMLSKNDGTSSYGEITTIAESPLDPHILWVGTDDGNVQVSRDGGSTWKEVGCHIPGVDRTTYVSRVEASAAGVETAWVTLDAHRRGDFKPYVFKTEDFGKTWKKMTQGLPPEGSVNVIREHPDNPDVLFLGTEHALFVSTNTGQDWVEFSSNLPPTLYDDLRIHPQAKDLVVGTHGRSLWILDDTSPLAEWSQSVRTKPAHLFSIRPASLHHYWKSTSYRGQAAYAGQNPPLGAIFNYHLSQSVESVKIVIQNQNGHVVRELQGSGEAGIIHRMTWDLSYPDPPSKDYDREREGLKMPEKVLPELKHPTDPQGPFVSPGTYTVTLHAGSSQSTKTVQVKGDPEMPMITQAQYESREAFLVELLELQKRAWDAAEKASSLKKELTEKESSQASKASQLADRLDDIRGDLYRLAGLYNRSGATQPTLYPPTPQHRRVKERLKKELRSAVEDFQVFQKKINRP
ncbi:hypothetical protein KGY73_06270 [bacterium]|nr:hypothetical protein [bacterium]